MTNEEIEELLSHLRELVAKGNFFKVTRRENKVPLKNSEQAVHSLPHRSLWQSQWH